MGIGLFRIILALTVVITHTAPIYGFTFGNPVIAVRSFFVISGFYMALILNEKYNNYRSFITNRFLRIYPIYWGVLIITVAYGFYHYNANGNWVTELQYYAQDLKYLNFRSLLMIAITNITIFGRELIMYAGIDHINGNLVYNLQGNYIIPAWQLLFIWQAWTLSIELMFYVIAPFLTKIRSKNLFFLLVVAILFKYIIHAKGLTSTYLEYRFFPNELCYFILGIFAYRIYYILKNFYTVKKISIFFVPLIFINLIIFPYIKINNSLLEWVYYLILTFLLPFVFIHSKKLILDRKIGELSYPIYISHGLVAAMIIPQLTAANQDLKAMLLFVATSIFSIFLIYFIQSPIEKLRYKIFEKHNRNINEQHT